MKSWRAALRGLFLSAIALSSGAAAAATPPRAPGHGSQWPADGVYTAGKSLVYVGLEGEPPDHPWLQFFDESTRRIGTLVHIQGSAYRSAEQPYLRFDLRRPVIAVVEDRHMIHDALGNFGFSVWHAAGADSRPLVVLLEGSDDSTRDMGFLIPYFVRHGVAVLTFDQRGTGVSSGNWRYIGPDAKADDVVAALRSLAGDRAIDFNRVGVWGPSNGGWVAPIVAQHFPLAFMILKSADSGTIVDNVLYEVRQQLERDHRFSPRQVDAALAFERRMLHHLATNSGWRQAREDLRRAKGEPWFSLTRVPADFPIPPPAQVLAAYRAALIYDPTAVLERTTVATLALFGALDRSVDVRTAERGFRADFGKSGMKELTIRVFPGADHVLERSKSGYEDDGLRPERFASGYPEVMIHWLRARKVLPAAGATG